LEISWLMEGMFGGKRGTRLNRTGLEFGFVVLHTPIGYRATYLDCSLCMMSTGMHAIRYSESGWGRVIMMRLTGPVVIWQELITSELVICCMQHLDGTCCGSESRICMRYTQNGHANTQSSNVKTPLESGQSRSDRGSTARLLRGCNQESWIYMLDCGVFRRNDG
jgi:hypothetical protein